MENSILLGDENSILLLVLEDIVMQPKFKKIRTEHGILSEFHWFLLEIEKIEQIVRLIPGRISRQQKGSSQMRFSVSYPIATGLKCVMSKGSTAQELFVVCREGDRELVAELLRNWKST